MQWGQFLDFPTAVCIPWIQILHNNDNHWMVVAGGYRQLNGNAIYDSLLQSEPLRHTIYAVSQICPEKKDELKLYIMKVQKQKDGFSCGLFAIANATALAFGLNPSEYVYDPTTMRSHFVSCCRNRKIEPFPFVQFRKCRNWRPSFHYKYPMYFSCKMPFSEDDEGFPERFRTIVECKGCRLWFHVHCGQIPLNVLKDKRSKWRCVKCI
jgi:hypothetical protein